MPLMYPQVSTIFDVHQVFQSGVIWQTQAAITL